MEQIEKKHPEFLLGASLEYLHGQSVTWINELDFIEIEIVFLYRLLKKERSLHTNPSERLADIEKELVTLHADGAERLKNDLKTHQHELVLMLKNETRIDDHDFREKHSTFIKRVDEINRNYRELKKRVFSLVQLN